MPHFDRFDIAEAYYLFATHYHLGGDTTDRIFWRLHAMKFKPGVFVGCSDQKNYGLTPNGGEIYNDLVSRHPDAARCREYLEIDYEYEQ